MTSRELDNLVGAGLLKREPPDQKEFAGLLASGRRRLADAGKKSLALESRFDLAYNAGHAFSLAAMRWHGYRPDKRFIVFQALVHTLGVGPEVWRVLDKCHGIRNSVEYEGAFEVTPQLVADLARAAETVRVAVEKLGQVPTARPKKSSATRRA
jgi:hypothetical protein